MNNLAVAEFVTTMNDEVRAQTEADPKLASILADMFAKFHQANYAVQSGQYGTIEEAVEATMGGCTLTLVDSDTVYDDDTLGPIVGFEIVHLERGDDD